MGCRALGRALSLLGVLVLPGMASAEAETPGLEASPRRPPSWVRLVLPECPTPPIDAKILLELLRTELRDQGVQRVDSGRVERGPSEAPQAYLLLTLDCSPDAHAATLRVEDPTSRKATERQMEFADLPPSAKHRTLALGLAELLRASWTWLAMLEPPLVSVPEGTSAVSLAELLEPEVPSGSMQDSTEASPPESPATPPPLKGAEFLASLSPSSEPELLPLEHAERTPSLQLGGKALGFFDLGTPVWGGQALGEYGRWALGAQFLAGTKASPRGKVTLRLVTGTLGFTALELSSRTVELRSGVSLAAGRATVGGTPLGADVTATQGAAPYLGAMLFVRTRWWFSEAWACTLEAEAGHAWGLIATVDGQKTASLAGWAAGLSLGVSFAP